jgi:hypothetical protein|nr:hypothetical protein [Aeromicrobium sp.]
MTQIGDCMFIIRTRRAAAAAIASLALVGLTACGGSDEPAADKEAPASSAAPEPSEEPAETPEAPAAASGDLPAWAKPATNVGEKITTLKAGDITVDVYQVGTTKATKTGQFVDPDTNKPLLDTGDDIVFFNYVITNNGAPIDLGSSLVSLEARYADWKYLQGMDSIVDDALFEAQNVNDGDLAPGGYNEKGVYTLGTGQTYSYGENFKYQKGSEIEFEVTAVPVDAEGELLHDQKLEGKATATVK